MQTPHAGVAGGTPQQRRRSPLTWLILAGAVGILLVVVAFAASGGLGSPVPATIIRPGNGAASPPATEAPVPTPSSTPTPSPTPTPHGKHKHDAQTPAPPDGGG